MQTHRLRLPRWPESSTRPVWVIPAVGVALSTLVVGLLLVWSVSLPAQRVAAGVTVAGVNLSGLTESEVRNTLQSRLPALQNTPVHVTFEDQTWQTDTEALGRERNYESMVQSAMSVGRRGPWSQQLKERWSRRWTPIDLGESFQWNEAAIDTLVASIAAELETPGRLPAVQYSGSQVVVDPGERQLLLDRKAVAVAIQSGKYSGEVRDIPAPVAVLITPLSADGVVAAEHRAEKLRSVTLELVADPSEPPVTIPAREFVAWLTWPDGFNTATLEAELAEKTSHWNRDPVDAEFELSPDGKRLTKFSPHRLGRVIQLDALIEEVQTALTQAATSEEATPQPTVIVAQFVEEAPARTLESTNTLGIKERIAVGTSEYKGSIPNRVFNVGHTANLVHGTVIAPGEEFSFNQAVGDISARTGFKSAYVIMNGRTQLGDGGGVCQVSTTIFRAALNGGLPITRWKAHSYRVGYYEQGSQPGFDATVYAPSVDFRFRNDTGHSIALAAYPDSTNQFLTIELWGTSDGRQSEISDYKIWNQRSAPEPLFVDDPSLPAGKRQQIDWAAAGANTSFHYQVKNAAGEVMHDREFVSIFRPWQAVYLVGTGQQ